MQSHSLIVLAVFVWNAVLPDVEAMRIVGRCSQLCAEERRAKSECVMKRNCYEIMMSNNLAKFAECAEPCSKIGDCFERCALGADAIKQRCAETCEGLSPCYDDCYNEGINQKMAQVFTKRPTLNT